jgi:Outer membrane protein beta-barrel domain
MMRRLTPTAVQRQKVDLFFLIFGILMVATAGPCLAGDNYFAGGLGGIATLSADHGADVSGSSSALTAYGTQNGPAFMIFFGRHFTDHISGQVTYGWNRNDITPDLVTFNGSGQSSYSELRDTRQQSVMADFMLYFQKRSSFARPYLSVGTGWTRLESSLVRLVSVTGLPTMLPSDFSSSAPALRVAVGIDIFARKNWAFRYSFAETIRSNAISQRLTPPGPHDLANFQNLFGFTWQF